MTKRLLSILSAGLMTAATMLVAYGDLVFSNGHFKATEDTPEITLNRNRFVVNSQSGSVKRLYIPGEYEIPEYEDDEYGFISEFFEYFRSEHSELPNGSIAYIGSIYLYEGEYWALEETSHSNYIPGWIRMDELLVLYTADDYIEQNKDKFYSNEKNIDSVFIESENLVVWEWPGSDREKYILNSADAFKRGFNKSITFSNNIYVDFAGREWAQVSAPIIWYKERFQHDYWICLSDPENADIPAFHPAPPPARWSPDGVVWSSEYVSNNKTDANSITDVLYLPQNDFYENHESMILYLGRSFAANGDVQIKTAPNSKSGTGIIKDGETAYINYSCLYGGEFWGYTQQHEGWVKLNDMLVLYDYVAFEEEFLNEFHPYEGNYSLIKETNSAVIWQYPGAEEPLWTVVDLDMEHFRVSHAYTDKEGREWGFVPYLYGSRNIWVCLSTPLDESIGGFHPAPPPAVWESDTPHTDIKEHTNGDNSPVVLIIVLVAVVVAGSAVLIRIFWKPNKPRGEEV
ncbi:MAG: hypothetical protein FWG70_03495 [Oscillospiraceae bacterium]|nr:hypothetical protein [Oscillospiraceae bacterium]